MKIKISKAKLRKIGHSLKGKLNQMKRSMRHAQTNKGKGLGMVPSKKIRPW